jgi:hypothetical protein
MYSATKNDIKTLAQQIENLAKEVATTIDSGGDVLSVANRLVRDSTTFVFTLGEVHAVEQLAKSVSQPAVKKVSSVNANYHNVRDSLGRFKKA